MKREIVNTQNRRLRGALVAGALAAIVVGVTAAPALADTWVYGSPGYYYAPSTTVYAPAPAYYTEPVYAYPPPVYSYGPGVYLDTPILNFGFGFHHDHDRR